MTKVFFVALTVCICILGSLHAIRAQPTTGRDPRHPIVLGQAAKPKKPPSAKPPVKPVDSDAGVPPPVVDTPAPAKPAKKTK